MSAGMSKEVSSSRPSKRPKKSRGAMADRFFPNEMPGYVDERESSAATGSSLIRLLSLPDDELSAKFLKAGVDLKDKVSSSNFLFCFCLSQIKKKNW